MRKCLLSAVLLCAVLASALGGCSGSSPVVLPGVEIREYQGQNLSSINDFEDNSIAGTQHINAGDYQLKITGLVSNATS